MAVDNADASCRLLQGQPYCKADKPHQHQSPREGRDIVIYASLPWSALLAQQHVQGSREPDESLQLEGLGFGLATIDRPIFCGEIIRRGSRCLSICVHASNMLILCCIQ